MKRFSFLLLLLLVTVAIPMRGQAVYNLVRASAQRVVNNPTSSYTQIAIAQFKVTALSYIKQKAPAASTEETIKLLDTQAYFLSEFLTLFMQEIVHDSHRNEEARREKIMNFMQASFSNPLFSDPDRETTHAYVERGGELTPFSLDTDWQKAFLAAREGLK